MCVSTVYSVLSRSPVKQISQARQRTISQVVDSNPTRVKREIKTKDVSTHLRHRFRFSCSHKIGLVPAFLPDFFWIIVVLQGTCTSSSHTLLCQWYVISSNTFRRKRNKEGCLVSNGSQTQAWYFTEAMNALMSPWSLPRCPWNTTVEIYNFLIGCPLPKRTRPVPLPFQKPSIHACKRPCIAYREGKLCIFLLSGFNYVLS